ncbi:MAG: hypothetical protein AB1611_10115 [bacterium]
MKIHHRDFNQLDRTMQFFFENLVKIILCLPFDPGLMPADPSMTGSQTSAFDANEPSLASKVFLS